MAGRHDEAGGAGNSRPVAGSPTRPAPVIASVFAAQSTCRHWMGMESQERCSGVAMMEDALQVDATSSEGSAVSESA